MYQGICKPSRDGHSSATRLSLRGGRYAFKAFGNPPMPLAANSPLTIPNRELQSSKILNAFLALTLEISVATVRAGRAVASLSSPKG